MTLATKDGKSSIYSGKSRSGKTVKCERDVRGFKTVFVWDIEAQWCKLKGFKKITSLVEFKKIVQSGKAGKYAFVSSGNIKAEFELWCMCVFYYGSHYGECAAVAEELADVTNASKASEQWGMLNRRGLKRGISIFSISQRWAEADKTAIGNATDFFVFQAATQTDADYIAKKTRIPVERINGLRPLEYIHYSTHSGLLTGHKVTF